MHRYRRGLFACNYICWVFKWDDLLCIWFLYSVPVHTKKPTERSDWRVKNARFLRPENKFKEIINYQKIWNAFQKIAINETSLEIHHASIVRTLLTVYYSFHPQNTIYILNSIYILYTWRSIIIATSFNFFFFPLYPLTLIILLISKKLSSL